MTNPMKKIHVSELYNEGARKIFYNGELTEVEKPIFIDMSSLFENIVTIVLDHKVEPKSFLGFDVTIGREAHSVVAKVISVKQMTIGYEARALLEFIPEELIREIEEYLSRQALTLVQYEG